MSNLDSGQRALGNGLRAAGNERRAYGQRALTGIQLQWIRCTLTNNQNFMLDFKLCVQLN